MTAGLSPAARSLVEGRDLARILDGAGLGRPAGDVCEHEGRNTNLSVRTEAGAHVFVKRCAGSRADDPRPAALLAFEDFARANRASMDAAGVPALLACDPEAGITVYPFVPDATDLAHAYDDRDPAPERFRELGTRLAHLHGARDRLDLVPTHPHRFPPVEALDGLTVDQWAGASAGELEAWAMMQGDAELCTSLRELRESGDRLATAPIHGDLRLDQVLVTGDDLRLTDFEEFCLGDPARDAGAVLGDVAYRAVLAIIKDWNGEFALDVDLSHEEIVDRGTASLESKGVEFAAFWDGYRAVAGSDDALTVRVTAWIGWHMFDRLLAAGRDRNRLLGVHRAAAGIGRAAITDPDRYHPVFEGATT